MAIAGHRRPPRMICTKPPASGGLFFSKAADSGESAGSLVTPWKCR